MDDSSIDRAIDEVAQEMTAGGTDHSFCAQIMTRIERIERIEVRRSSFVVPRSSFVVRRSWFGFAAVVGVAALLIFAFVQVRRPQSATVMVQTPTRSGGPAEARRHVLSPADAGPLAGSHTAVRRKPDATYDFETPDAASDIDALAPPRLDVESIALSQLSAPASIAVDELETITPIALAPLSAADQGERR